MRTLPAPALLLALLLSWLIPALAAADGAGPAADADALLGRYWLPDRDGEIELYRDGDRYSGRVVRYDVPDQRDVRNADAALRGRPFVGIDMLQRFAFDASDGRWVDGTIYDAYSGKTYDARLWFERDRPDVLYARGFVGTPWVGRTVTFDRMTTAELAAAAKAPAAEGPVAEAASGKREGDEARARPAP